MRAEDPSGIPGWELVSGLRLGAGWAPAMPSLCWGLLRLGSVLGVSCLALSSLVQLTAAAKVSPAPPSPLTGAPPPPPALRKPGLPNAAHRVLAQP